jgi:hypothetical protein
MKSITYPEILELISRVSALLNKNKVPYLIYGSLAYKLITKDEAGAVHDVDILVKQDDFDKLEQLLKDKNLKLNPVKSEFNIHANHMFFTGEDGKQFDLSFDSIDHYFRKFPIDLSDYEKAVLGGVEIKLMKRENLDQV